MRKYLIISLAVLFAANAQTVLFARELSKTVSSMPSLEEFLLSDNFDTKGLRDKLSDSDSIALEKVLLSPAQIVYNDLTKNITASNKAQIFQANIERANKLASLDVNYANSLPQAYYKIYQEVLANPSASADFNLTSGEISNLINKYTKSIITYFKRDKAFIKEQKAKTSLSFVEVFNTLVKQDVSLLSEYYAANNLNHFSSIENYFGESLHHKKLIQLAALRVIEADLLFDKHLYSQELARFDFISLLINAKTDTKILFDNEDLLITKGTYKYVPFNPGRLVSRTPQFIISLQEIEKKKQNPSYNFATKKSTPQTHLSRDYEPPAPSVYDSPWGAGSVR